jgi:hypothetical protein
MLIVMYTYFKKTVSENSLNNLRTLINTMNVGTTRQTGCLLYVFMCTGMLPFRIVRILTNTSMH